MIKKLYEIFQKYKLAIILIIVIIVGILLVLLSFNNNSNLNTITENNYAIKYDSSWKIKNKNNNSVIFKHKTSDSLLKIEIIKLDNENKYSSIDDLIDEVIYNIANQNKNYKLLSKKEGIFTKNKFSGYKMLYEIDNSQVMVSTFKKSDNLIITSYESPNDYFDILVDSINNIIYNFDIPEEKFSLNTNLKIKTNEITYSTEKEIENILEKTKTYEIAYNNYYVSYSIPDKFQLNSLNTTFNSFDFKDLKKGSIKLNVNIMNRNTYEYLDKNNSLNLYKTYEVYKKDKDCSGFKEIISKLDNNKYIYKNSYYYNKAVTYDKNFNKKEYRRKNETVELIYGLNNNHILVLTITTHDVSIPEKLVKMIKINDSKNYSSYIKVDKKEGYITGELKRFFTYNNDEVENIIIKIPEKYTEYDKNYNLYETRNYGLNYNEELDIYDYQVKYYLTSNFTKNIDGQIDIINNSFTSKYGEYNNLVYLKDITINDKTFAFYQGGYTELGGIMFTNIDRFEYYVNKKILFYKMDNGGFLIIEISGNGKEITDDIINELTNFKIEEEKY